jgi:hypothetical protein
MIKPILILAALALPIQATARDYRHNEYHNHSNAAAGIGGIIAGVIIGSIISHSNHNDYEDRYDEPRYYVPPVPVRPEVYDNRPRTCVREVYNDNYNQQVIRETCYIR